MKQLLIALALFAGTSYAASPAKNDKNQKPVGDSKLLSCFCELQDYLQRFVKNGIVPHDCRKWGTNWLARRAEFLQGGTKWLEQLQNAGFYNRAACKEYCQAAAFMAIGALLEQLKKDSQQTCSK